MSRSVKVKTGPTGESAKKKRKAETPDDVAALEVLDGAGETQHYACANTGRFTFRPPGEKPRELQNGKFVLVHDEGLYIDFGEQGFKVPIEAELVDAIEKTLAGEWDECGGVDAKTLQQLALRDQLCVIYPGEAPVPMDAWDVVDGAKVVDVAVAAGKLPNVAEVDASDATAVAVAVKKVQSAAKYEASKQKRLVVLNELQVLYDRLTRRGGADEVRYDAEALDL